MNGLITLDNELYHYGMPRRSGRYKWGSGERPYQGDNISNENSNKQKSSHKEKTNSRTKIALGVGIAGTAAVGAVLYKVGGKKIGEFRSEYAKGSKYLEEFLYGDSIQRAKSINATMTLKSLEKDLRKDKIKMAKQTVKQIFGH